MKKRMRRWLAILACGFSVSGAYAYSGLYVFGDSLSDVGNDLVVLQQLQAMGQIPSATATTSDVTSNAYITHLPYASGNGSFTNGANWVTSFAGQLGLSATASLQGGGIYAYGGAKTGIDGIDGGVQLPGFPYSLNTQVGQYLSTHATSDANALYVLAGGGNNARDAFPAIATADPATAGGLIAALAFQYAHDVGSMVDALQASGAQHIVVWDTPNIGLTPAIATFGAQAQGLGLQISLAMNSALRAELADETGVTMFSIFDLLNTVALNGGSGHFTNTVDACAAVINNGGSCNPDLALFWDGVHPTAAAHAIIADAMVAAVSPVPEPASVLLMAAGAAVVAGAARRRRVAPQLGA